MIAFIIQFWIFTLLAYAPFLLVGYSELEVGFVFFGWGVLLAIASIFVAPALEKEIHDLPHDFSCFYFLHHLFGIIGSRCIVPSTCTNQYCSFWFFPRDHQYVANNDCNGNTWVANETLLLQVIALFVSLVGHWLRLLPVRLVKNGRKLCVLFCGNHCGDQRSLYYLSSQLFCHK